MKPRFIALNLLLLAGIGVVAWEAHARWSEAQETRVNALNAKTKPAGLPPLAPEPKPDVPAATKYVDVATKDLFSKDRNPTVVIEAPKEEKPKPMPPLPIIYGVMGLPSGTKALMAERADAASKSVRAGDSVGDFKIVSLDPQTVVFNWQGKDISKKVEDLMDRSNHGGQAAGPAAAAAPGSGAAPPSQPQNPPPGPPPNATAVPAPGATGPPLMCKPNDSPPAGSIVNGYRKVVTSSMFGPVCHWVAAQ